MSNPSGYVWQDSYLSAVLETDDAAMPTRIHEALAAIEQRLLKPIESGCGEHKAIENAQSALRTLKVERATFKASKPASDLAPAIVRKWSSRNGIMIHTFIEIGAAIAAGIVLIASYLWYLTSGST